MQVLITVSRETYEALREYNLRTEGRGLGSSETRINSDGTVTFPVSEGTADALGSDPERTIRQALGLEGAENQ